MRQKRIKMLVFYSIICMLFIFPIHVVSAASKSKEADTTTKVRSLIFKNLTGGDFVQGNSKATISFYVTKTTANVKVDIQDSKGKTVFTKKFGKCRENRIYSFNWTGKNKRGKYVHEGFYRVCITAGNMKTFSKKLKYQKSDFAGGDGSESKPYQVENLIQLKNVEKYNGRYFEQTADINGYGVKFVPMFSTKKPFNGVYDGNGYTISFLKLSKKENVGIFSVIGANGVVRNVVVVNFTIQSDSSAYGRYGCVAGLNWGTITNCTVKESTVSIRNGDGGGICGVNQKAENSNKFGVIQSCTAESVWIAGGRDMGGIVGGSRPGKIVGCNSISVTVEANSAAGGIIGAAGETKVMGCSVTGNCSIISHGSYRGAIAGYTDRAEIVDCYSSVDE